MKGGQEKVKGGCKKRVYSAITMCILFSPFWARSLEVEVDLGSKKYATFPAGPVQIYRLDIKSRDLPAPAAPDIAESKIAAPDDLDTTLWKAAATQQPRKHTYTLTADFADVPFWVKIVGTFVKPPTVPETIPGDAPAPANQAPPPADFEVTVPNVDFLDISKNRTAALKVAKWENGFNAGPTVKDNFIDLEPRDQFYVSVNDQSKKGSGMVSVRLSTDSAGTDYDDDATRIELPEDPANSGIFISKSMLMVSDDVDDDFTNPNVVADDTKNDRTHKVALGGKVKVRYPGTGASLCEKEASVLSTVTHDLDVVIMRNKAKADGGTPLADEDAVKIQMAVIAERYAQLGYKVTWTISTEDPPPLVVNLENGELSMGASPGDEGSALLGDECRNLIDAFPDGEIFYVGDIVWDDMSRQHAWAVADYWYADSENNYVGRAFVGTDASVVELVAAHELGHLIGNTGYFDSVPDWHLMAHQPDWTRAVDHLNNDNATDQKRWRFGDP